jgi:hypothetical protein
VGPETMEPAEGPPDAWEVWAAWQGTAGMLADPCESVSSATSRSENPASQRS